MPMTVRSTLRRSLALVAFLLASMARAQDAFELPSFGGDATAPAVSYSPKDFGVKIPLLGDAAEKTVAVKASIARARESLDDVWNRNGAEPVAFLVVETRVANGWHVYSQTQGSGGMPTTSAA